MENRQITLVSSDGEKVQISEKAAKRSFLIKGILEDYPEDPEVPLHNVKSNILTKIFMVNHRVNPCVGTVHVTTITERLISSSVNHRYKHSIGTRR